MNSSSRLQKNKTQNRDSSTCLVRVSLTKHCSCDAKRVLTSFNSAAKDTTFFLKLCFFSFKSFNKGSISLAETEEDDEEEDGDMDDLLLETMITNKNF